MMKSMLRPSHAPVDGSVAANANQPKKHGKKFSLRYNCGQKLI